jgi:hypothetical protein
MLMISRATKVAPETTATVVQKRTSSGLAGRGSPAFAARKLLVRTEDMIAKATRATAPKAKRKGIRWPSRAAVDGSLALRADRLMYGPQLRAECLHPQDLVVCGPLLNVLIRPVHKVRQARCPCDLRVQPCLAAASPGTVEHEREQPHDERADHYYNQNVVDAHGDHRRYAVARWVSCGGAICGSRSFPGVAASADAPLGGLQGAPAKAFNIPDRCER